MKAEKVAWEQGLDGEEYPICPKCFELAYFFDKCVFCGQIFDTEDEKLQAFNNPVMVEKDGYTATQSSNKHVHVTDSKGRLVYHASSTRKMSREELCKTIDFVKGIKGRRGDL